MAYAAVISLKETIHRLLNSSHTFLNEQLLEHSYKQVESLQQVLTGLDDSRSSCSRRLNALDGQIREAVCKFEDALESHLSDHQLLSQSDSHGDSVIRREMDSFVETMTKMKEGYEKESDNSLSEEEHVVLSRSDSRGKKLKMVGFSEYVREILGIVVGSNHNIRFIPIVGMAGIGKTILAKQIFNDPTNVRYFECRAWVTVGRNCQSNQIVSSVLQQIDPANERMAKKGDERSTLRQILMEKRYLIVMDDVWDLHVWEDLQDLFQHKYARSAVIVTTRLQEVALQVERGDNVVQMQLLDGEESWRLLCRKVFDKKIFPPQFEKAGKKIAENCDGLPLMIVTVANLLSTDEMSPEYWNKVALDKKNSIYMEAYNRILKVLYRSYNYLPQYLKPCFLYMGVFPQNNTITTSKLFMLWSAEGFLENNKEKEYLMNLVLKSLVIVSKQSFNGEIKTCRLHSSFWYLCKKEATKNKYFHALNSYADSMGEGLKGQRRMTFHKNVLFSIKNVYNSIEDNCASTARSLLCFGPYYQYQVPKCFEFRLLRVLDALTIRTYQFPFQVLKLVRLRYLALTCNGKIPHFISKLSSLQFLIVRQHLTTKSSQDPSYLPVEIWNMKELKHLQVTGSNLPDPIGAALLPNLVTLLDVSTHSCTKRVLERLPNLEKLGITNEFAPIAIESSPLHHISHLNKLKSLKCVMINPVLEPEAPPRLPTFPTSLKKLSLSGFGYPWEEIDKIATLPNLEVLKLRNYAFRGPKWIIHGEKFLKLKYLLIEDTDLVAWKSAYESFKSLKHLIIKNCYKLQDIPFMFHGSRTDIVQVVDCNPSAVALMERIRPVKPIHVHCSWEDRKLKS